MEEGMLKLGEYQELTVVKRVAFGVYLAEEKNAEKRIRTIRPEMARASDIPNLIDAPKKFIMLLEGITFLISFYLNN